ncbi:hypothetical protein V498_07333 [Pseudogymnoascus sp. VKM F-4517 (FW-2822)]|nr:hypothetical protein V498_07333 [Pseudogymnoascus sp. VKM F-4517 (FW-2822)]
MIEVDTAADTNQLQLAKNTGETLTMQDCILELLSHNERSRAVAAEQQIRDVHAESTPPMADTGAASVSGVFAPWDAKVNLKAYKLSDDLSVNVFVRVHAGHLSSQLGSVAPNFYTPTHNHIRAKPKVVRQGAPFALNLTKRPPLEELIGDNEFIAYMESVASGKYAVFSDTFLRKNPGIFISITSPSLPNSIGGCNPPRGPFFGLDPRLFSPTAVRDAESLCKKMLSLQPIPDDDENSLQTTQPTAYQQSPTPGHSSWQSLPAPQQTHATTWQSEAMAPVQASGQYGRATQSHQRAFSHPPTHPLQNYQSYQDHLKQEYPAGGTAYPRAQPDNGYAQHDAKLAFHATLVCRPSDVMMADATGRPATPQGQLATPVVPRTPDVGHQLRVDAMFRNVRDNISLICSDAVLSVRQNPTRSLQQMQDLRAVFDGIVGETEAILRSIVEANPRSG